MKMRIKSIVILLFLLTITFSESFGQQFTSDKDRFTVWMPATPTLKSQTIDTNMGKVDVRNYILATQDKAFIIGVTQLPIATEDPEIIKLRINNGRDKFIEGMNGKLLSEKEVDISGYSGIEIKAASSRGIFLMRFCLVKYSIFQFGVFGSESFVSSGDVNKFINSFKFLNENIGEKWTIYSFEKSGFSVEFPSKPMVTIKIPASENKQNFDEGIFLVGSINEEFGVIVTTIPTSMRNLSDDNAVKKILYEMEEDFNILSWNRILFKENKGIEVKAKIKQKSIAIRVFTFENRLYYIFCRGENENMVNEKSQRFFNSFQFLKIKMPSSVRKTPKKL